MANSLKPKAHNEKGTDAANHGTRSVSDNCYHTGDFEHKTKADNRIVSDGAYYGKRGTLYLTPILIRL